MKIHRLIGITALSIRARTSVNETICSLPLYHNAMSYTIKSATDIKKALISGANDAESETRDRADVDSEAKDKIAHVDAENPPEICTISKITPNYLPMNAPEMIMTLLKTTKLEFKDEKIEYGLYPGEKIVQIKNGRETCLGRFKNIQIVDGKVMFMYEDGDICIGKKRYISKVFFIPEDDLSIKKVYTERSGEYEFIVKMKMLMKESHEVELIYDDRNRPETLGEQFFNCMKDKVINEEEDTKSKMITGGIVDMFSNQQCGKSKVNEKSKEKEEEECCKPKRTKVEG